ncbi:MAG: hypothetical protein SFV51_15305 [Bryobacteraceae bacterium]|nr:hypothetical protein [Bryobacteraceae bacterium]
MDQQALERLRLAARSYSELRSLTVDITVTSDMEDQGQRTESRSRAIFLAPNLVRTEAGRGRMAIVTVFTGTHFHHYFGPTGHYTKSPIEGEQPPQGFFNPEFPSSVMGTFLFPRIAERVEDARLEEADVLSVRYAPSPHLPPPPGPLRFRIDPQTHLVTHIACQMPCGHPFGEPMQWMGVTAAFTNFVVNPPVDPAVFEFTPPPGTVDRLAEPRQAKLTFGFGGGGGYSDPDSGHGYQTEVSNTQDPDGTLIERTRMQLDGIEFALERRLRLSEDRRELRLEERVSTAMGDSQLLDATVQLV